MKIRDWLVQAAILALIGTAYLNAWHSDAEAARAVEVT